LLQGDAAIWPSNYGRPNETAIILTLDPRSMIWKVPQISETRLKTAPELITSEAWRAAPSFVSHCDWWPTQFI
jgi:hypothetical protein